MNRAMLTREDYDRIRAARDARVRERFAAAGGDRCAGCGGDYENVTAGCDSCWDRMRRRKRREDPVKHAHDLRIWREARQRRTRRRGRRAA